jgi:UDP-N-acetylglucosamine 4,6-dehydratase
MARRVILVTGGTGSFGNAFVRELLTRWGEAAGAIRIYSRDEFKQSEMARELDDDRVRFLVGDVRDRERLTLAARGVDVIIHAAALKQVPSCEYNPDECNATNVNGTVNVKYAAIANKVPKTILLSTDKAVNPVNTYGASKLMAERIMVGANAQSDDSRFSVVRYGNVIGSRGSVVPLFKQQASAGEITITDDAMTRFWLSLDQTVDFVLDSLKRMQGGEVFVPKMPSMRIADLAHAIAPDVPHKIIGLRPGEKVHETLITKDESRHAQEFGDHFTIRPSFNYWLAEYPEGEELPPGFAYMSNTNTDMLVAEDLVAV